MKSMTGYGSSVVMEDNIEVSVEMKSVNSRFLDCSIKLPQGYLMLEMPIRNQIKQLLSRGRIECVVLCKNLESSSGEVVVQWDLLKQLHEKYDTKIAQDVSQLSVDFSSLITGLFTRNDFVEVKSEIIPPQQIEAVVDLCIESALEKLVLMREKEGKELLLFLSQQLDHFTNVLTNLKAQHSMIEKEYRHNLFSKIESVVGDTFPEERVLTEVALMIEKGDIQEEIDRLNSHISAMNDNLHANMPVGREMDFLVQEMNREVNTIGSKSSNLEVKKDVIQMKTILEKMKEQIQNIE